MRLGKLGADNDARRHAAAAVIERVPRLGKAHRGAEALAELRGSGGDIGLRQHRNAAVFGLEERDDLARLALPFHGHVGVEIEPVLGEQIPQEIFRRAALAGRVDRFSLEIGERLHGLAVELRDIQHAQHAHGAELHAAGGLIIKYARKIERHRGDVHAALQKLRRQLVRRAVERVFVAVRRRAGVGVRKDLRHAHGRGAGERGKAYRDGLGRLFRRRDRRRGRLGRGFRGLNGRVRRRGRFRGGRAAGGKSEKERQRKGERGKFLDFHRSGSSAFDISLTV